MTQRDEAMRLAAKSVQPIGPEQTRAATAGADAELARVVEWLGAPRTAVEIARHDLLAGMDYHETIGLVRLVLSATESALAARAHWPRKDEQ